MNSSAVVALVLAVALGVVRYNITHIHRTSLADKTVIDIPSEGSRFKVITRGFATRGARYTVEESLAPGAVGFYADRPGSPPLHIHPQQVETFEVKEGTMWFVLNGTIGKVPTGQKATIPKGMPHTFWNGQPNERLTVHITLEPALSGERFFETMAGAASWQLVDNCLRTDYGSLSSVNPLQMMLMFCHSGVQMADVPASAWRLVINGALCPLASALGYQPFYDVYRTAVP